MDKLREADAIVDSLGKAMQSGETGLRYVPALLLRVVNEDLWRERVIAQTGERVAFERFLDFVTTQPLEGLGADLPALRRLCADNPAALDAIDRATKQPEGGDKRSAAYKNTVDNINGDRPDGTSAAYALRKLRSDAPDAHARVLAGELSPHAAMVEAGFRRKTLQIPTDVEGAAQVLMRRFTYDDLCRLVQLLAECIAVDS